MPFEHHGNQFVGSSTVLRVESAFAPAAVPASKAKLSIYEKSGKRAIDLFLVLISSIFVVPLIALIAILVACDGHNPFYTQRRIGRNGRTFRILKIRTMVPRADAILERYLSENPELKAEWEAKQKLTHDIRVTRIGRILRKTSLDELPQLWNVLNGSMSLVGPRPMMLSQQPLYHGRSYFRLRPGITGLWQVSDRHNSDFQDRVKYDNLYKETLSLATDVKILARTVAVVLRGTGC